jgi:hypothetical protein
LRRDVIAENARPPSAAARPVRPDPDHIKDAFDAEKMSMDRAQAQVMPVIGLTQRMLRRSSGLRGKDY